MISLSDVEASALATGLVVVAFVNRATLTEGDEVAMAPYPVDDPVLVQPTYHGLAGRPFNAKDFTAVVVAVHPAALLDPIAGAAYHVWNQPGAGDLVVLRVYGPTGPVIEDARFAMIRAEVEGALRA